MKNKETQCDMIIKHMANYGTISHLEAHNLYGIERLASRINDLKKKGWDIDSTMENGVNRYGKKTRFAVYSIGEYGFVKPNHNHITNFEAIKKMNIEELAKFLHQIPNCIKCVFEGEGNCQGDCLNGILLWLQKEVNENEC